MKIADNGGFVEGSAGSIRLKRRYGQIQKMLIYLRAQQRRTTHCSNLNMWTNSWKTDTKAYKAALMYLVNCPMAQMVSANRLINAEGRFTVVDMGSASLGGGGGKLRQVETLSTPSTSRTSWRLREPTTVCAAAKHRSEATRPSLAPRPPLGTWRCSPKKKKNPSYPKNLMMGSSSS